MSTDWFEIQGRVTALPPAQREYWTLVLERLQAIESLAPEEVTRRLGQLRELCVAAGANDNKAKVSSSERLVHQLTQQLAGKLFYDEGQAVNKLADPLTSDRAPLWDTLHSARRRVGREQPADPTIDKSLLKQAMPSEELCVVWRCLAGFLKLDQRDPERVKKWRLDLAEALEGAKSARGKRLKKLQAEVAQSLTEQELAEATTRMESAEP